MGIGLQPTVAMLLVLAQLPLPLMSSVDLLGRHGQPTRHLRGLVAVAAQPAKHARRPAIDGLLVGGEGCLGLLAVGGGPGQLAATVPGRLVELAAQAVAFGPQLRRGQPLEIWVAGGVDGQRLAARSGQGVGQLQVGVGVFPVGQVELAGALGFGADHHTSQKTITAWVTPAPDSSWWMRLTVWVTA